MAAKFLAPLAAAGALAACSFEPVLTTKFVDYNRAFEDSSNSILLLNVLRAKDRKPLYFSTVTQLNPTIGGTGELTLSIPLNPTAYTNLGISTRGTINTSNTATVATENTQEFMRGFLQPISIELFDYFWQQGWPRSLLLHMLVHKIELAPISGPGRAGIRKVRVFSNAPFEARADTDAAIANLDCAKDYESSDGRVRFACFQELIQHLEPFIRFGSKGVTKQITPKAHARNVRDWRSLIDAAKPDAKLSVKYDEKTGRVHVEKPGSEKVLCISEPTSEPDNPFARRSSFFKCGVNDLPGTQDEKGATPARKLNYAAIVRRLGKQGAPPDNKLWLSYKRLDALCGDATNDCEIVLHLRSPEAMVYYLGEAARMLRDERPYAILLREIERPSDAARCRELERDGRRYMALFALAEGRATSPSDASVRYDGDTFSIPKGGCHRSMQALSLVSIILGLHRRATDLPRTSTVNVVGP